MFNVAVDYDKLSAILTEKRLSKPALAKIIGISENTLKGSFIRKTKMSTETVCRISKALNIPPELIVLPGDFVLFKTYKETIEQIEIEYKTKTNTRTVKNDIREFNAVSKLDKYIENLNIEGLEKAVSILEALVMVPEYRRTDETETEETETAAGETSL